MTAPAPISKFEKLQLLRADYGRSLHQRLGALMQCWETVALAHAWGAAHSDMLHHAHSLAGSAGTFGYARIGAEAKRLEEMLSALSLTKTAPSDVQKASLLEMLQNLWRILEWGPDDAIEFNFAAHSGAALGH